MIRAALRLAWWIDQHLNDACKRRAPGLMKERADRVSTAWLHQHQENQWRTR